MNGTQFHLFGTPTLWTFRTRAEKLGGFRETYESPQTVANDSHGKDLIRAFLEIFIC